MQYTDELYVACGAVWSDAYTYGLDWPAFCEKYGFQWEYRNDDTYRVWRATGGEDGTD